ncbi:hypothetical protein [Myroides odoratimimus]|uniref:hypothetical protein n=1 Tax=Myroides odoratimimus TaxID=76832 RepID=UPI0025780F03|nr:hypothetical protein [Myroides odoratimimus]MDM1452209.1 hypothetical protein [Myroides odoratimimus]MDM1475452.1 hypothetical protein [Myroides odoratimimus]MDM1488261.1 hypothetical protein [Myroides odoratimimus]MEC4083532.1 hypothetical protein [Myroides odoratimimus]
MKQLLLLLTLLLSTTSFAQHIYSDKIDKFTDNRLIHINASKDKTWGVSDSFTKNLLKGGIYLSTHITVTPQKEIFVAVNLNMQMAGMICLGDNELIALFENGDKVTLKQISKVDCGKTVDVKYDISDDDIDTFRNSKLKDIRIYTRDGYMDFVAKDKMKPILQATFQLTADKLKEIQNN